MEINKKKESLRLTSSALYSLESIYIYSNIILRNHDGTHFIQMLNKEIFLLNIRQRHCRLVITYFAELSVVEL